MNILRSVNNLRKGDAFCFTFVRPAAAHYIASAFEHIQFNDLTWQTNARLRQLVAIQMRAL
eukprot:7456-Heterococcus_DN1.PRE.2